MDSLSSRLEAALGRPLGKRTRLSGGSINQAFRFETETGPIFVKHHPRPPTSPTATFFAAEAKGLERLVALRTPRVLCVLDDALALEWIDPAPRTPALEAEAGGALAALHELHAESFGLDHDNFMGALPQDNRSASRPDFHTFFRERRLMPLAHHLPPSHARRLELLPLAHVINIPSPPTLIHGDLWSGNLLYATTGPVFLDPAVYYGHPEQDLAMTRLFGGFTETFYAAYRERRGITFDRDFDERLAVLQLYPLLVHVALFGGHYFADVGAILARFT